MFADQKKKGEPREYPIQRTLSFKLLKKGESPRIDRVFKHCGCENCETKIDEEVIENTNNKRNILPNGENH